MILNRWVADITTQRSRFQNYQSWQILVNNQTSCKPGFCIDELKLRRCHNQTQQCFLSSEKALKGVSLTMLQSSKFLNLATPANTVQCMSFICRASGGTPAYCSLQHLVSSLRTGSSLSHARERRRAKRSGGKESGEEMLDFTLAATPRFKKTVA